MTEKVFITLEFLVRFKRIANGEKVIEQTGPDIINADVRADTMKRESWVRTLPRLLDEAASERRRRRREERSRGFRLPSFTQPTASKNHRERTGAVE